MRDSCSCHAWVVCLTREIYLVSITRVTWQFWNENSRYLIYLYNPDYAFNNFAIIYSNPEPLQQVAINSFDINIRYQSCQNTFHIRCCHSIRIPISRSGEDRNRLCFYPFRMSNRFLISKPQCRAFAQKSFLRRVQINWKKGFIFWDLLRQLNWPADHIIRPTLVCMIQRNWDSRKTLGRCVWSRRKAQENHVMQATKAKNIECNFNRWIMWIVRVRWLLLCRRHGHFIYLY